MRMGPWTTSVVATSLLVSVLAACTSSGKVAPSSDPSSAAPACSAYYDAYTAYLSQCQGGQQFHLGPRDQFAGYCERTAAAPGAAGTTTTLTDCTAQLQTATSTCAPMAGLSACKGLTGTLPTGSPCASNVQCKTGRCTASNADDTIESISTPVYVCGFCADLIPGGQPCELSSGNACVAGAECRLQSDNSSRLCTPVKRDGLLGASCDDDKVFCAPGLQCDHKTHRCAELATTGGDCLKNDDCMYPLVCGKGATCQSPGPPGAACKQGNVFANTGCARNLTCDSSSRCAQPLVAAPHEACDGVATYCSSGFCATGQPPVVCPEIIPDGQSCDSTQLGVQCAPYSVCANGVCTAFDASACR